MSVTVTVDEAQRRLPELLGELKQPGDEVTIAENSRPVARLVPVPDVARRPTVRRPGSAKGQFVVPDSFFDPLPEEILRAFEGEP